MILNDEQTTVRPYSLNFRYYEAQLDEILNITLGEIKNGTTSYFHTRFQFVLPFREGWPGYSEEVEHLVVQRNSQHPDQSSMLISSQEDLDLVAQNVYSLAYIHHLWGKEVNMRNQFPKKCCGMSSVNLFLNLLYHGYPNAMVFANSEHDHTYVGLPFATESSENGVLIVDPTSDQLFEEKNRAPRNHMFVADGSKWSYHTNWFGGKLTNSRNGADLYPSISDRSVYSNLRILRTHSSRRFLPKAMMEATTLEQHFNNPIKINPTNITTLIYACSSM